MAQVNCDFLNSFLGLIKLNIAFLFRDVFEGLDKCEQILSKSRYIAGDQLTEADVRLWVTLIRFDPVSNLPNKLSLNNYN